jgi:ABC-2 type transport system ATP-binding protein
VRSQGLVVRYGRATAVDDLSFEVAASSVVALLGPNGAGKSSTVRCLVGLQEPQAGRIEIGGHDLAAQPRAAKATVGYVPENGTVYEALTPNEMLLLKGRLHGLDDAVSRDRARCMLEVLGLVDRADDAMAGFSKGMRQKVVLACALLPDPSVLILDEPMSGLDVETTQMFKELLAVLCARGKAILYSSHLLDVVEKVADRVLILAHGRLAAAGTVAELRARPGGELQSLDSVFRTATHAADPRAAAERLLAWPR